MNDIIKEVEAQAKERKLLYMFANGDGKTTKKEYWVEESFNDRFPFAKVILNNLGENSWAFVGLNPKRNESDGEKTFKKRKNYCIKTGKPLYHNLDGDKNKKIVASGSTWNRGVNYSKRNCNACSDVYFFDICPVGTPTNREVSTDILLYVDSIKFIRKYLSTKLPQTKIFLGVGNLPEKISGQLLKIIYDKIIKDNIERIYVKEVNDKTGSTRHLTDTHRNERDDTTPQIHKINSDDLKEMKKHFKDYNDKIKSALDQDYIED